MERYYPANYAPYKMAIEDEPWAPMRWFRRRKMVRRSLAGLIDEVGIVAAGVDPTRRAETLTPDEWAALARQVGSSDTLAP